MSTTVVRVNRGWDVYGHKLMEIEKVENIYEDCGECGKTKTHKVKRTYFYRCVFCQETFKQQSVPYTAPKCKGFIE